MATSTTGSLRQHAEQLAQRLGLLDRLDGGDDQMQREQDQADADADAAEIARARLAALVEGDQRRPGRTPAQGPTTLKVSTCTISVVPTLAPSVTASAGTSDMKPAAMKLVRHQAPWRCCFAAGR